MAEGRRLSRVALLLLTGTAHAHGQGGRYWTFADLHADPKKLLEEALGLPMEARAALAGSLIGSLDESVDEDAEEKWAHELERRVREIDSGVVRDRALV